MPASLSQRLHDETAALHAAAERAAAVRDLLRGRLPRDDYARLLRALHAVYDALERGLARHADDPRLALLPLEGLARAGRLADDLAVVAPGPADRVPLLPEAAAYAERLARLAERDHLLLVAHAYVRYLGDLAGGRLLGGAARRAYDLAPEAGAAFYEFPAIPDADLRRGEFRAALDRLPLSADAAARLVAEARWAFAAHARLFAQLAAPHAPG